MPANLRRLFGRGGPAPQQGDEILQLAVILLERRQIAADAFHRKLGGFFCLLGENHVSGSNRGASAASGKQPEQGSGRKCEY